MSTPRAILPALALFVLAACGGASSGAGSQSEPEPVPIGDGVTGEPVGHDSTAPSPSSGDPDATPERCYVVSVDGQEGCWASADEACTEVCGGVCTCTEATVNNTCGC